MDPPGGLLLDDYESRFKTNSIYYLQRVVYACESFRQQDIADVQDRAIPRAFALMDKVRPANDKERYFKTFMNKIQDTSGPAMVALASLPSFYCHICSPHEGKRQRGSPASHWSQETTP